LLKIRRYFRSRPRAERIEAGRRLLRQHIVKEGLYPLNLTANDKLVALLRRLPVRSIDDLYDKVALGYFQCAEIVGQLKEIHLARVDPVAEAKRDGDFHPHLALVGFAGDLGLELAGGQPLRRKAEIMRCCTPVPGDRIYGLYDRQERRVHVHRLECGVLTHEVGSGELMELSWSREREDKRYPARILLVSLNRVGLLFEVLRYLSTQNINLGGAEFAMTPTVIGPDANARTELIIEVADSQELEQCMAALRKLDDVFDVKRLIKLSSAADEEHH